MKTTTTLAAIVAAGIIARLADRLHREQAVRRMQDEAIVLYTAHMRELRQDLDLEREWTGALTQALAEHEGWLS
jgi:hypothetical protein